jgi:hypothetical protein
MTLGIIIPLAVAALCSVIAYTLLKSLRPEKERAPPVKRHTMRCGTPYLRNGGTLVCQTGDVIEIVTREGTETMTLGEYIQRKAKQA